MANKASQPHYCQLKKVQEAPKKENNCYSKARHKKVTENRKTLAKLLKT